MKFVLKDAIMLKEVMTVLKDFTTGVTFKFSAGGLVMQCMDASHVSMACLKISSTSFSKYDMEGVVQKDVSISMAHLSKILKLITPKAVVSWDTSLSDNALLVQIADVDKKSNYQFTLKLMDIEEEELEIPELPYTHRVSMVSSEFKKLVGDTIDFGDRMTFTFEGNTLDLVVCGDAGELAIHKEVVAVQENTGVARGKFSNKYITLVSKADKVAPNIKLSIAEGMPIELEYAVSEGTTFTLYIAPQIDDDEMEQ